MDIPVRIEVEKIKYHKRNKGVGYFEIHFIIFFTAERILGEHITIDPHYEITYRISLERMLDLDNRNAWQELTGLAIYLYEKYNYKYLETLKEAS